jgi:hypothetical protein
MEVIIFQLAANQTPGYLCQHFGKDPLATNQTRAFYRNIGHALVLVMPKNWRG